MWKKVNVKTDYLKKRGTRVRKETYCKKNSVRKTKDPKRRFKSWYSRIGIKR